MLCDTVMTSSRPVIIENKVAHFMAHSIPFQHAMMLEDVKSYYK